MHLNISHFNWQGVREAPFSVKFIDPISWGKKKNCDSADALAPKVKCCFALLPAGCYTQSPCSRPPRPSALRLQRPSRGTQTPLTARSSRTPWSIYWLRSTDSPVPTSSSLLLDWTGWWTQEEHPVEEKERDTFCVRILMTIWKQYIEKMITTELYVVSLDIGFKFLCFTLQEGQIHTRYG